MSKSAHTDAYAAVLARLVKLRRDKGVDQTELARRLGKTQQFVSYYERADRRIDLVEFYVIVTALGGDPAAIFGEIIQGFEGTIEI